METITDGDVSLYTYRTGLLRSVGHDLRLAVRRFEIEVGEDEISARFWPESIEVEGAMVDGELDRSALSNSDRKKIKRNIRRDVLETDAYPEVRFDGSYESEEEGIYRIGGDLKIVGVQESLRMTVRQESGRYRGDVELTPSNWGIEPYSALMGSLKLEDRVRVELDVA